MADKQNTGGFALTLELVNVEGLVTLRINDAITIQCPEQISFKYDIKEGPALSFVAHDMRPTTITNLCKQVFDLRVLPNQ